MKALPLPSQERRDWERFGEMVLADRGLHDQLRSTTGQASFIALAVRQGAARDCIFTASVVESALREQRRVWLERWI